MSSQSWGQLVASIPLAGTAYNTFTTAKSLLGSTPVTEASAGLVVLPSQFLKRGSVIEIDADLALSNVVTTPGTFNLQVMIGASIAFNTGAIAMTTTAHTNLPVKAKIQLTCRTEGSGTNATLIGQAQISGQGIAYAAGLADFAAGTGFAMGPLTAPAVGAGYDSTIANTLDLFAGFSISNAGNQIQLVQYKVLSWGNTAP